MESHEVRAMLAAIDSEINIYERLPGMVRARLAERPDIALSAADRELFLQLVQEQADENLAGLRTLRQIAARVPHAEA